MIMEASNRELRNVEDSRQEKFEAAPVQNH